MTEPGRYAADHASAISLFSCLGLCFGVQRASSCHQSPPNKLARDGRRFSPALRLVDHDPADPDVLRPCRSLHLAGSPWQAQPWPAVATDLAGGGPAAGAVAALVHAPSAGAGGAVLATASAPGGGGFFRGCSPALRRSADGRDSLAANPAYDRNWR